MSAILQSLEQDRKSPEQVSWLDLANCRALGSSERWMSVLPKVESFWGRQYHSTWIHVRMCAHTHTLTHKIGGGVSVTKEAKVLSPIMRGHCKVPPTRKHATPEGTLTLDFSAFSAVRNSFVWQPLILWYMLSIYFLKCLALTEVIQLKIFLEYLHRFN